MGAFYRRLPNGSILVAAGEGLTTDDPRWTDDPHGIDDLPSLPIGYIPGLAQDGWPVTVNSTITLAITEWGVARPMASFAAYRRRLAGRRR